MDEEKTKQEKGKFYNFVLSEGENKSSNLVNIEEILWSCGLSGICLKALWLPLGALVICFATAYTFQQDDIHETHCRVYNVVPSISAITGIHPQCYLWRICIAFHLGPRLLIGSLYRNYHKQRSLLIPDQKVRKRSLLLGEACYWLNLVEMLTLTGVTYISNRENYYVHEKVFILFTVVSLVHMLCRALVGCTGAECVAPVKTNAIVWTLFAIAITSTVGVVVFFLKHRLLCHDLAFTWFSVCEYILACTNMAFHAIVVKDLPHHSIQVVLMPQLKIKDN